MRFQPLANNEFVITPETETEYFYINNFLRSWQNGFAGLKIVGSNKSILELTAQPDILVPIKTNKI